MAALTGFAPVSLGLKDRDPDMLDDKAEWSADERDVGIHSEPAAEHSQKENTRPASPFNAIGRTACWCRSATNARSCDFRKKERTPSSLSAEYLPVWKAAGFYADVGLIDWAQR